MNMIADLTDFMIRKGYIEPEDRDIYLYGYLLLLFPLVLHPNKAYLEKERRPLSVRSAVVTVFILATVIICNMFWSSLLYAFSATFLLS